WKRPSSPFATASWAPLDGVSILVLLETAFKLTRETAARLTAFAFQSLFSWKRPSSRTGSCGCVGRKTVSILVLLETAFKPRRRPVDLRVGEVSILVLLETAFKPRRVEAFWYSRQVFQSLFSWKRPSSSSGLTSSSWLLGM